MVLVSFTHGFAYLRPRKVASTSTEFILSKYCDGPSDIVSATGDLDRFRLRETYGLPGPKNHYVPPTKLRRSHLIGAVRRGQRRPQLENHCSAAELKHVLGKKFQGLIKVSSTRDPYDRLISFYHFRTEHVLPRPSFLDWFWASKEHLVDELRSTTLIDGSDCVDFYIRQDNFKGSILQLCQSLGLPSPENGLLSELSIDRKPSDRDRNQAKREYFDEATIEFIQDAFRPDFVRHSYNLLP